MPLERLDQPLQLRLVLELMADRFDVGEVLETALSVDERLDERARLG